jgi:hypothetical protein
MMTLLVTTGVIYRPDNSVVTSEMGENIVILYTIPPGLISLAAPIYGVIPAFIKTEELFQKYYTGVVFDYQFLKRYLLIAIIFLMGITIYGRLFAQNYYPDYIFSDFDRQMFSQLALVSLFVTVGGILRFVTQVGKKGFRFYFAKACCKIMSEKADYFQKMKYLRLLLQSYDGHLKKRLKVGIDENKIYSIILYKTTEERSKILNQLCKSVEGDKLDLAKYLSSIHKVLESEFYIRETFLQQLKPIGVILATAIPIIISIISILMGLG